MSAVTRWRPVHLTAEILAEAIEREPKLDLVSIFTAIAAEAEGRPWSREGWLAFLVRVHDAAHETAREFGHVRLGDRVEGHLTATSIASAIRCRPQISVTAILAAIRQYLNGERLPRGGWVSRLLDLDAAVEWLVERRASTPASETTDGAR